MRAVSSNEVAGQAKPEIVSATSVKTWESTKMNFCVFEGVQTGKMGYVIRTTRNDNGR